METLKQPTGNAQKMMDRGRPKVDPSSPSYPSYPSYPSSTSKSPSSRQPKPVPAPKIEPVKRKPVPSSASPLIGRLPPLSTGGVVVAVGEDEAGDYKASPPNQQSFPQDPPSLPPPNVLSPPLQVRDLDQWVHTFLAILINADPLFILGSPEAFLHVALNKANTSLP